jgi:hypothetical protein
MATIIPDLRTIRRLHQKPTEGELKLISFLDENLSSEFEVYFQPFINGDKPDIVLLKKNGGVIIFEVKDWHLDKYSIDENTDWHVKSNNCKIKSPYSQVKTYKDNLYDLHIDSLLAKRYTNKYYNLVINTVVYFHNEYESTIKRFCTNRFDDKRYTGYKSFLRYIATWGKDSLTTKNLNNYITKIGLYKVSKLFDDDLYNCFKRYLQPPLHLIEEGITIKYTKEQQVLIRSESRPRRKVKGLAGSGKTFVLAKRAVNAHLRTNGKILILTYNLSLKNYIHDRISDVREEFSWDNFYITNYHQFIKSEANNYGLVIKSLAPFHDVNFFEPVKNEINKYDVILIDEIQDYTTKWLEIITKYFLAETGEFVVFGDEKQNIYNRPLDENNEPIIKTIPSVWNRSLNVSKRFSKEIGRVAIMFQKEFLSKYTADDIRIITEPTLNLDEQVLVYKNFGIEFTVGDIFDEFEDYVKGNKIHPSNISILAAKVDWLRELDYKIRKGLKEKTITTFETKEYWTKLKEDFDDEDKFHKQIEKIRRNKKNHFWMKNGLTKLSSIHSFKGWESHTIFLLIEEDDDNSFESAELIYTGLTRAQHNLVVFNLGNHKYHDFFNQNLESSFNKG